MQKWEAQFVKRRLLIVNEELTFQKMAECTQMTEFVNRGVVFKCQVVSGRMKPFNSYPANVENMVSS